MRFVIVFIEKSCLLVHDRNQYEKNNCVYMHQRRTNYLPWFAGAVEMGLVVTVPSPAAY